MEFVLGIITGISVALGAISIFSKIGSSVKKRKKKRNSCDCMDINNCSKRCNAKIAFNKDFENGLI